MWLEYPPQPTGLRGSRPYRGSERLSANSWITSRSFVLERYAQIWTDPQNGNKYQEYCLPKDLTLTLVAGYRVGLRYKIIKRLEELEQGPRTIADWARVAIAQEEANAALKIENATLAPKASAYDAYLSTEGVCKISDFCNKYGVKVRHPGYVLRDRGMMHKNKLLATQVGLHSGVLKNIVDRSNFEYVDSKGRSVEAQSAHVVISRENRLLELIVDAFGSTAFRNNAKFMNAKLLVEGVAA